MTRRLLPPPAETILIYAAWGWADEHGHRAVSGRPRLPERHLWVPIFYDLIARPSGLAALKRLARAGCRAWSVAPSITDTLDDAFSDPRLKDLFEAAIVDLAATARDRFVLPDREEQTPAARPVAQPREPPPAPVEMPRPVPMQRQGRSMMRRELE